ncbi:MAG: hypothetical protein IT427_01820 [Pirellulales bacterium]|nr:hypothetical protein [Pirellulales bacterium]
MRNLLTVALTSVTDPINSSNAANAVIQGTGDVGAAISVAATDGTLITSSVSTTVGADGKWSIASLNVAGLHDGTITYIAGDTTHGPPNATRTAVKDTASPIVLIVSVVNPLARGATGNAIVHGIGEVGATVSLSASDGSRLTNPLTTTVPANGVWSIEDLDLSELLDGTIHLTVTATDAAGNRATSSRDTSKITADGSLSGFVYVDANKNHRRDANEHVLQGVLLALNGVDGSNALLPTRTTLTASDGSYQFAGLIPGTYQIREVQPAKLSSQRARAGTLGGVAKTNIISQIEIASGDHGMQYDFGEKGLKSSAISINPFLASSSPSQQQLTDAVARGGTFAPAVTSIDKLQIDPTAASTVKYAVHFNKPVRGVDINDFLLFVNGLTGAAITKVSGSGDSYTVSVNTGAGNGALSLNLGDNDTIVDRRGIPLGGGGLANGAFIGSSYTIAKTPTLSVTSLPNPIDLVNVATASIIGTGEPGAVISLVVGDVTHSIAATFALVAADGSWTIGGLDLTAINDGSLTFTVTALNAAGKSAQLVRTTEKDTLVSVVGTNLLDDPNPTSGVFGYNSVYFNKESVVNITLPGDFAL